MYNKLLAFVLVSFLIPSLVLAQGSIPCPKIVASKNSKTIYPGTNFKCFTNATLARNAGFVNAVTPNFSGSWRVFMTPKSNTCQDNEILNPFSLSLNMIHNRGAGTVNANESADTNSTYDGFVAADKVVLTQAFDYECSSSDSGFAQALITITMSSNYRNRFGKVTWSTQGNCGSICGYTWEGTAQRN